MPPRLHVTLLLYALCALVYSAHGIAQPHPDAAQTPTTHTRAAHDGQHDFDFEIGSWKTHLSRLLHPLTDSKAWADYEGTTTVRRVWNGRANLVELEVDGAAGHIEALSLRLYNPDTRKWSLNFASVGGAAFGTPALGEFKNGRGEFYDQETFAGRNILVRFVISDISTTSCHFEQAFSEDGGKSWQVNWIATDTRTADGDEKGR